MDGNIETAALLVTVFCLLLCLQPSQQGDLNPGEKCHKTGRFCKPGLMCEGRNDRCIIRWGGDCSKYPDLCGRGLSCDAAKLCKSRVKGYCAGYYGCGVGGLCIDKKCRCNKKLFYDNNGVCTPKPGTTGTACTKHKNCTDPLGKCNMDTKVCECKPPYVASSKDFTCKFPVGHACNITSDCRPELVCDADKKCTPCPPASCKCHHAGKELIPGMSCAGDKANLCLLDDVCKGGLCRNKIGDKCPYYFSTSTCEPPTQCWTNKICSYTMHQNCSAHMAFCEGSDTDCDRVTKVCKRKVGHVCYTTDQCPYSSTCIDSRCRCQPNGNGVWNESLKICEVPVGKVGGRCNKGKDVKKCDDPNAKCRNRKCICKLGHVVDPNYLTCSMRWRGCSLTGQGNIYTFFKKNIKVRLPCTFKLAKIRCGRAKAEVYAQNTYNTKIHNNLITAISVTIADKIGKKKTTITYRISNSKISEHMNQTGSNGSAWETTSSDAESTDSSVILSTDVSSGVSVLRRKLLKVTYTPPVITSNTVSNWGKVLTECAHHSFDGLQEYPYALCGKLEDEKFNTYSTGVEAELKKDLPDTYENILSEALSSARLTDRAILIEQKKVVQSNPLCKEASNLVASKDCPALQKTLYECSNMYDANRPDSYPACVDTAISDPMKLFVSCLRAQCDRVAGGTCETLKKASEKCPDKTEVSGLLTLANCTSSET